jgi:paraquat-inducible protein B
MFEENRLKLGIFVIAGVSLMVGFLFFLGVQDAMKSSFYLYTYFNQSVQGLEVGSPVKFKGVTVGTVSKISIFDNGQNIRVEMKTQPGVFGENEEHPLNYAQAIVLFDTMKKDGLGCEQKFTGITGMKIIEIDYFKDGLSETDPSSSTPINKLFLPAHKSSLENSLKTVSAVIDQIGKIDFEKLRTDLTDTVAGINKLVNNKEIPLIIKSVEKSAFDIEKLMARLNEKIEEINVKEVTKNLNTTLSDYQQLAKSLDKEIKAIHVEELSKEARISLAEVTKSIKQLKETINTTLETGNDTLIEVQQVMDDLNEDPSAVIHGKQREAIFQEK